MNNFNYKNMTPFKWFVLENFPFIENDFEAINNYRLFSKVVEYLNKMKDNVNLTGQQMENLTNAMIELQNYVNNYFDNLDVQDEINNKLDEMVEQGTLQEIIADYLNSKAIFGYDTINDMKNATNLIDGSYARTLGRNNYKDGKGYLYKIREITNEDVVDNFKIIALNDENLIAEKITNNIYIYSYDYLDENSDDNSIAFNTMVNTAIAQNKSILIKNGIYKFTKPITLYKEIPIIGEGNVVFDFSEFDDDSVYCIAVENSTINSSISRNRTILKNITFKGYNFESFPQYPSETQYINKNLFFIKTHEFDFDNIYCYGFNKVFTYGSNAYIISVRNSLISHNNYAIYFDYEGYSNSGERITFINTVIGNNRIAIYNKAGMLNFTDCSIDYNLQISSHFQSKISGTSSGRSSFMGCHFEDNNMNITNRFVVNNGVIMFSNCSFWFDSLPYFIDNSSGRGSRLYFTNCDYISSGISGDEYITPIVQSQYRITNEINTTPRVLTTNYFRLSKFNKYITNNYSSLIANVSDGTAVLDDDNSLKTTSNNYVTATTNTDYIEIPYGKTQIWTSLLIKGNSQATGNKKVFAFFDDNKTQLSTVSTNWNLTTDYEFMNAQTEIPDNAKYVKVYLNTPLNSGGITNYKDVYIDFN